MDTERNVQHCPKCNGEFPSQNENRRQWILDVIRENQAEVSEILCDLSYDEKNITGAKSVLDGMQQMDRDAILMAGGILTKEQWEQLK